MKISNEEYIIFSELFAQKYELNKDKPFTVSKDKIEESLGLSFIRKINSTDVHKIRFGKLQVNEVALLCRKEKDLVSMFAKRLRNCSSHSDRITKKKGENDTLYYFEDMYNNKAIMRCKMSMNTIKKLSKILYNEENTTNNDDMCTMPA